MRPAYGPAIDGTQARLDELILLNKAALSELWAMRLALAQLAAAAAPVEVAVKPARKRAAS